MIRLFAFAAAVLSVAPALAGDVPVAVGKVATVMAEVVPGTVVIGDPRIADVAVEGRTVMVFGKAPGETDLVVFDQGRELLFSRRVMVGGGPAAGEGVTVIAPGGGTRWSCPPGRRCVKEAGR